jgi:hypothetical protein
MYGVLFISYGAALGRLKSFGGVFQVFGGVFQAKSLPDSVLPTMASTPILISLHGHCCGSPSFSLVGWHLWVKAQILVWEKRRYPLVTSL